MSLRLILMRHSEAEKSNLRQEDIARHLTKYGQEQAASAAKFLSNFQIDKLLLSPAKRTMQTANILSKKVAINQTEIIDELYAQKSIETILKIICCQDNETPNLLLLSHNPLIYELALYLAAETSAYYQDVIEYMVPTGTIIMLNFANIKYWRHLECHQGEIIQFHT